MMIMLGVALAFWAAVIVGLGLGDRLRTSRHANRQFVMHELAEHYAVENYVLLSQAVGVLERMLDDDADLAVFTNNQRRDAEQIVRTFHQRQLPKG